MDQDCARLVERLPSRAVELQAKVDVVEGHGELLFLKAADREEFLLGNDQAGGRHRTDPLRQAMPEEIALLILPQIAVCMARAAADPRDHAGVLNRPVGVEQQSTDGTDLGP